MATPYAPTDLTHSDSMFPARPSGAVVRTTEGLVAGARHPEFAVFRKVPYARPPLGALRFSAPPPPVAWNGVRDAARFASPFLRPGVPESREDVRYPDVRTPDVRGPRPVLVYVHGGWQMGGSRHRPGRHPLARLATTPYPRPLRRDGVGWLSDAP